MIEHFDRLAATNISGIGCDLGLDYDWNMWLSCKLLNVEKLFDTKCQKNTCKTNYISLLISASYMPTTTTTLVVSSSWKV